MEVIDVTLGDFTLRCRSLLLSHVAAGLARGLEPGEEVVLHDPARGHYAARVADIGFEPADTVYRLHLGARLTLADVRERVAGRTPVRAGRVSSRELLDLLGELRSRRAVPVRGRRRDTAL